MYGNILLITLLSVALMYLIILAVRRWEWMPLALLVILWYIPRQTVPGGILEKFLILRWITVFIVPFIVIVQFVKMTIRSQKVKPSVIALPLAVYVLFTVASGIIHNVTSIELFGSMILYIRYPLLFIAFINMDIKKNVAKTLVTFFLFLVALQVPECLYRYAVMGYHGDDISWSLGPWGAFDLGIYAIYASALVVASGVVRGVKLMHLVFFASVLVLALLGEIKAFIICIPVISLLIIFTTFRQKNMRKYSLAIGIPAFFIILLVIAANLWTQVHTESGNALTIYLEKIVRIVTDPSLLVESEKADKLSSRILGSAYIWNYLRYDWRMLLFGVGPGSMLAGNLLGTPGKIVQEIPYLNQIAVIVGETGLIGLALYFWILLRLLAIIRKAIKVVDDTDIRTIAVALVGMWCFYAVIGPFYDLVWRHDSPNFFFYFLIAFLYRYIQDKHELIVTNNGVS